MDHVLMSGIRGEPVEDSDGAGGQIMRWAGTYHGISIAVPAALSSGSLLYASVSR